MNPDVMIRQVEDLPNLTRTQFGVFSDAVDAALSEAAVGRLNRVVIIGDGDSYHAAEGVELAFKTLARIPTESMSAQRFLNYAVEWLESHRPHDVLVIGISAGGRTERGVQALRRARENGALTLAVTGNAGSPFTEAAERSALMTLPDMGRSPGIRTYNASLLGLYLIALRLGEVRGRLSAAEAAALRHELAALDEPMQRTLDAARDAAQAAVELTRDANKLMFVGSGPSYGSALFCAAKVVEASGVLAMGQDLEEWSHVERYAHPADLPDMPLFVIAPPGRSHGRAVELAELARALGRRVLVVAAAGDAALAQHAHLHLPIAGDIREEFSPLVYHIPIEYYSAYLTRALGRLLFQSDRRQPQATGAGR